MICRRRGSGVGVSLTGEALPVVATPTALTLWTLHSAVCSLLSFQLLGSFQLRLAAILGFVSFSEH